VPGGHAGPAIHRKVVSIVQAKSCGPIDVGRNEELWSTIYEYLTHLPSS